MPNEPKGIFFSFFSLWGGRGVFSGKVGRLDGRDIFFSSFFFSRKELEGKK